MLRSAERQPDDRLDFFFERKSRSDSPPWVPKDTGLFSPAPEGERIISRFRWSDIIGDHLPDGSLKSRKFRSRPPLQRRVAGGRSYGRKRSPGAARRGFVGGKPPTLPGVNDKKFERDVFFLPPCLTIITGAGIDILAEVLQAPRTQGSRREITQPLPKKLGKTGTEDPR